MTTLEVQEIARRIFPGVNVETEFGDIVIEFLRITPTFVEQNRIGQTTKVPGFELTLDTGEDSQSLVVGQLGLVLIEAAKFYAGWKAQQVLNSMADEAFAKQLELERTPEWKAEVAAAIKN